jgi:hypothetical protein
VLFLEKNRHYVKVTTMFSARNTYTHCMQEAFPDRALMTRHPSFRKSAQKMIPLSIAFL